MPPTRYGPMPYTAEGKAIAEALNAQDGEGNRMADAARARTEGGNPTRRREFEQTTPRPQPTQLAQGQPGQGQQIDLEQILQVLMAALGQGQTQRRGPGPPAPPGGMTPPPQQMQRRGMAPPPQQMPRPGMPPQQRQRPPGMPPQMPMRPPQRLA